jgi:hypothetical protein
MGENSSRTCASPIDLRVNKTVDSDSPAILHHFPVVVTLCRTGLAGAPTAIE